MTQFLYPASIPAGAPVNQATSPNLYLGQHMGTWYHQDEIQPTYGLGAFRHQDASYYPFARQVPHYQQHHVQQPQHFYPYPWVDPRFVPRHMPPSIARPTARSVQTPAQAPIKAPVPDAPRGPPRKPKQSGHAVWIGNLPVNTTIHELKDYCSRDAKDEIESVFLISKSNCAFANYKSQAACEAALYRIQSISFHGRRLVCRLRMQQTPSSPSSSVASYDSSTSTIDDTSSAVTTEADSDTQPVIVGSDSSATPAKPADIKANFEMSSHNDFAIPTIPKIPERYFIIKSLCVEDLIASVNNCSWEAQRHNEKALCQAFETTSTVYLIFSANKSGEYFGLARMKSTMYTKQMDETTAMASPTDGGAQSAEPSVIHTQANEVAPCGKIHDDSLRGTVFWEADQAALKCDDESVGNYTPQKRRQYDVEWLSTSRVPFYRTRGLRNPWNGQKEVKIARDGTELEPTVGRHMMGLFRSS